MAHLVGANGALSGLLRLVLLCCLVGLPSVAAAKSRLGRMQQDPGRDNQFHERLQLQQQADAAETGSLQRSLELELNRKNRKGRKSKSKMTFPPTPIPTPNPFRTANPTPTPRPAVVPPSTPDCIGDVIMFESTIMAEFMGRPEDVTPEEVAILEEELVASYNQVGACGGGSSRMIINATKLGGVTSSRARQLQFSPLNRTNVTAFIASRPFVFRFAVVGECTGCTEETVGLFEESMAPLSVTLRKKKNKSKNGKGNTAAPSRSPVTPTRMPVSPTMMPVAPTRMPGLFPCPECASPPSGNVTLIYDGMIQPLRPANHSRRLQDGSIASIDSVTGLTEANIVLCDPANFNTITSQMIVEYNGVAMMGTALTAEETMVLETAFVDSYNAANYDNPRICDPFLRRVSSATIIETEFFPNSTTFQRERRHRDLQAGSGPLVSGNGLLRAVFQLVFDCDGCADDTPLVGQPTVEFRNRRNLQMLGTVDDCSCPIGPMVESRGPTLQEFFDVYSIAIGILTTRGSLASPLLESVDDMREVEPASCVDEVDTFQTQVLVSVFGDPDAVTEEDQSTIENAFVRTYNDLAELYCDLNFRAVIDAEIVDIIDINTGMPMRRSLQTTITTAPAQAPVNATLPPRPTFRGFVFRFLVTGRCRGCPRDADIFDDVRRAAQELTELTAYTMSGNNNAAVSSYGDLRTRALQMMSPPVNTTCYCPVSPIANRAPSEAEFQSAFNQTIIALQIPSVSFVTDVDESEVVQIACAPEVSNFTTEALVDVTGDPAFVTETDITSLETTFVSVYNNLTSMYCDLQFRFLIEATIVELIDPLVDGTTVMTIEEMTSRSASLQEGIGMTEPPPTPVNATLPPRPVFRGFVFRFVITGQCRGCRRDARIFDDVRRMLQMTMDIMSGRQRQLQSAGPCFCPVSPVANRPPTTEEFTTVYNATIAGLDLDGVVAIENVTEQTVTTQTPSATPVDITFAPGTALVPVECSPDIREFRADVLVEFFGTPDLLQPFEIAAVEAAFPRTYNTLALAFCDTLFREVLEATVVEIIDPVPSTPARRLQTSGTNPVCFICGEGLEPLSTDSILELSDGAVTCGSFQRDGLLGLIEESTCTAAQLQSVVCECGPILQTTAPVTPAPVTPAPVTPAPVTPAPVTPAPVTPAPVTLAPVTPAPVINATLPPRGIFRGFVFRFVVTGRCRGCSFDANIFDDVRRLLQAVFDTETQRNLQQDGGGEEESPECFCPAEPVGFRVPTAEEFRAAFNETIAGLDLPNIESVTDVDKLPTPPDLPPVDGGVSTRVTSDPHFITWRGRFSFQGQCDVVYVRTNRIEIHLRLSFGESNRFSFVSAVAIKIGADLLEVQSNQTYYVNGTTPEVPPATIGGTYPFLVGSDNFVIDVGAGQSIQVSFYLETITLDISGFAAEFGDSIGMAGSFFLDEIPGRNSTNMTSITDPTDIANEWRVNSLLGDPDLFIEPSMANGTSCDLPVPFNVSAEERAAAEEACSGITDPTARENCIFDVTATGGNETWANNPGFTRPPDDLQPLCIPDTGTLITSECANMGGTCTWRCNNNDFECMSGLCSLTRTLDALDDPPADTIEGCSCAIPRVPTATPSLAPSVSASTLNQIITCISVIDESSQSASFLINRWDRFRSLYPDRPFCLLQPRPELTNELKIPPAFFNDTLTTLSNVTRDFGVPEFASDWFEICGLETLRSNGITRVATFVDNSGSLTVSDVRASIDLLQARLDESGVTLVAGISNTAEDWIGPFITDFA